MNSRRVPDAEALERSRSLVNYLADLADHTNRTPVRDVLETSADAPAELLWAADIPVSAFPDDADDLLLKLKPVAMIPVPAVPTDLIGWVDQGRPGLSRARNRRCAFQPVWTSRPRSVRRPWRSGGHNSRPGW